MRVDKASNNLGDAEAVGVSTMTLFTIPAQECGIRDITMRIANENVRNPGKRIGKLEDYIRCMAQSSSVWTLIPFIFNNAAVTPSPSTNLPENVPS